MATSFRSLIFSFLTCSVLFTGSVSRAQSSEINTTNGQAPCAMDQPLVRQGNTISGSYTGRCINGRFNGWAEITVVNRLNRDEDPLIYTLNYRDGTAFGVGKLDSGNGAIIFTGTFRNWSPWQGYFTAVDESYREVRFGLRNGADAPYNSIGTIPVFTAYTPPAEVERPKPTQVACSATIPSDQYFVTGTYPSDCRNGQVNGVADLTLTPKDATQPTIKVRAPFRDGRLSGTVTATYPQLAMEYKGSFDNWQPNNGISERPLGNAIIEVKEYRGGVVTAIRQENRAATPLQIALVRAAEAAILQGSQRAIDNGVRELYERDARRERNRLQAEQDRLANEENVRQAAVREAARQGEAQQARDAEYARVQSEARARDDAANARRMAQAETDRASRERERLANEETRQREYADRQKVEEETRAARNHQMAQNETRPVITTSPQSDFSVGTNPQEFSGTTSPQAAEPLPPPSSGSVPLPSGRQNDPLTPTLGTARPVEEPSLRPSFPASNDNGLPPPVQNQDNGVPAPTYGRTTTPPPLPAPQQGGNGNSQSGVLAPTYGTNQGNISPTLPSGQTNSDPLPAPVISPSQPANPNPSTIWGNSPSNSLPAPVINPTPSQNQSAGGILGSGTVLQSPATPAPAQTQQVASRQVITVPQRPTGLYPTNPGPLELSFDIGWSGIPNASYYRVTGRDITNGSVVVFDTQELTNRSRLSGLSPNRSYQWEVSACNSAGCSPRSETRGFFTARPTVPTVCRIEVRFTRALKISNHAFIVTIDNNSMTYFRGGPEFGLDNLNPSNTGSTEPNNIFFGKIVTEFGNYSRGSIDWTENPTGRQVIGQVQGTCDSINRQFTRSVQDIARARINYDLLNLNSNSVVRETLERAGYTNVAPVVRATAWDSQLP